MITFSADIRSACATSDDAITTGSVGIPVQINLSSDFAGLAKTMVFSNGTVAVDLVLVGDATEATVPPDVLTTPGALLQIGIYAADASGNIVIPTIFANVDLIRQGAAPSGVDPSEPTPSWVAQVQQMAEEALDKSEQAIEIARQTEQRMTAIEEEISGDLEQAAQYVEQAQTAAQNALDSAAEAGKSQVAAEEAQFAAETAYDGAVAAKENAETAMQGAETARDAAQAAQQSAQAEAVRSQQAAASAQKAAEEAKAAAASADFINFLPTDTASGPVASFLDGADGIPVKSLSVQITPQQAGSGDPSPDNVRPISGWTRATIQRTGKNLFDKNNFVSFAGYIPTAPTGTFAGSSSGRDVIYFRCTPGQVYTASRPRTTTNERFGICFSKEPPAKEVAYFNASLINANAGENEVGKMMVLTATAPADAVYVCVWGWWANSINPRDTLQIEFGPTASAYEPYEGDTYSVAWETEVGTVYGGTLDVNTGTLTARPYYASYAGEALVGPWISSMDVYAEGAVPTTGAQVLDLGGTAQTYQLTPQQVNTMLGVNNIWADTGDSSVTYRADVALYINKKLGVTG